MEKLSLIAILIACIFSINTLKAQATKTTIIPDNTHLFSDEAIANDNILKKLSTDESILYVHYQNQNAGQIHCEDSKTVVSVTTTISQNGEIPFHGNEPDFQVKTTCSFIAGSIDETKEKLEAKTSIFKLKDGRTIISVKANHVSFGDIIYEVEYEDLITKSPKKTKIVSERGKFSEGLSMINQNLHFINDTGNYDMAAINTFSSLDQKLNPQFGGLANLKIYSRSKLILK